MIVDNEEFYEQEKPLSLKDIRYLIVILREVLFGVDSVVKHACKLTPCIYSAVKAVVKHLMVFILGRCC